MDRDTSKAMDDIWASCLFVMLSYCGFWINPAATPGRVALGIITILVAFNKLQSVRASVPPGISYKVRLLTPHTQTYETPFCAQGLRTRRPVPPCLDASSHFTSQVWLLDFCNGAVFFNIISFLSMTLVNFGMQMSTKLVRLVRAATTSRFAPARSGRTRIEPAPRAKCRHRQRQGPPASIRPRDVSAHNCCLPDIQTGGGGGEAQGGAQSGAGGRQWSAQVGRHRSGRCRLGRTWPQVAAALAAAVAVVVSRWLRSAAATDRRRDGRRGPSLGGASHATLLGPAASAALAAAGPTGRLLHRRHRAPAEGVGWRRPRRESGGGRNLEAAVGWRASDERARGLPAKAEDTAVALAQPRVRNCGETRTLDRQNSQMRRAPCLRLRIDPQRTFARLFHV